MALFEIVDEIAKKQVEKTETGDNRIDGILLGQVTKNYDENMKGRVCVSIHTRDADSNELLWARVMQPSSGKSWGHYFLPEVGDQVLVAFEQGNIERPYVIGCIPLVNDKFLTKSVHEKNRIKRIVTRHGSTIIFEDDDEDTDGGKDTISIITAAEEHKILMNNEKDLIQISDKDGKNIIKINTADGKGNIEVQTDKKLTVKVGDNITLTMNGSNGTVELNASKINMKATESIKLEANGSVEITGANTTLKGNSMTKVESSGPVTVSGTPIKLG
ncbi:MAG: phage baseplate assembly protein V [Lachnospiraceae bacterium]|nr:phage baseplate assembly protein V [Lachnospiraceae bacterium]